MLFALWTENRATEDSDANSVSSRTSGRSSHHTVSAQTVVSRHGSIIMPPPVAAITGDDEDVKDELKLEKGTVEEAQVVQFEDQRPLVFKSTFWEICAVVSLVCAQLTNELAHTQQIAIPALIKYYHLTTGQQAWVSAAQGIPAGSFLLLFGRLADIFGRKRVLLVALVSHAAGGIICGASGHIYVFFLGRTLQGLACAGFIPAGIGILAALYSPGRRKNRVFSAFSAAQPLGGGIGGITAGLLTTYASWRWAFYLQGILTVCFVVAVFFFVPNDNREVTRREPIDWFGALLVSGGLCAFCFALTDAETSPNGWQTNYIIIALVLGVAGLALFILLQSRLQYPLMPLTIWRYPQFPRVISTYFLGFTTFAGVLIFNYTLMWQIVLGRTAIGAAIWNIPLWTTGLLTNFVASFILHRVSGTILLIVAECGILAAALLQALQPQGTLYWAMTFPSLPLMIIGAEFSYLVCSLFVLESVQKKHLSVAAGVFSSLMSLGSAIGAAASSSIRQHVSGQEKSVAGFHAAFWFGVGMAGVAVLLSLTVRVDKRGTREERIRKEREEAQGERVVDAQPRTGVML